MKLSVIIPVYNSSEILNELHLRINKVISETKLENNFEILMINDCSKDDSWKIIKNLSSKYSYIKGINLSRNFGQHGAIMAGLNYCNGEKIITLDDDLQHPPEFFPNILEKLDNFDVCYTYYDNRQHIRWKRLVSYINNIVSSFLLNKPFYIYMSSFRGLKKNVIENMIKNKGPNVYLDSLILKSTKKIGMITVKHYARKKGESNYTFKKLLMLWSNMVLNFSFYPLRITSVFGSILKFLIKFLRKNTDLKQYEISEKTF
jgi:undecaprenyl-phosphate 4-deoxy-4-formamido-L-arabinose transferase